MTKLMLSDNILALKFHDNSEKESFIRTAKFKIRLRRYVNTQLLSTKGNQIYFKSDITIHEMKSVIDTLENMIENIYIDENIFNYIEERQYFIDKRYRVGNDIKKRSSNVLNEFQDFKSVVNEKMVRPLTKAQLWNAFYMSIMRFVSNFSVPGSGKTATVLGTYIHYKSNGVSNKIVMIGPKSSFGSWIDEYKACFGIGHDNFYLNIHDSKYSTTRERIYALKLESGNKDLILINYESLPSLSSVLEELINRKTLLVFDEVHKIKNPVGKRASVSKIISEEAGAIITLTGTPIPNSYVDIYNILNILYKEDYNDFFGFSIQELKNADPQEIKKINEKINPFFCRISKEDLGVPPVNEDKVFKNEVNKVENELYKIIYQTYRNNLLELLVRIFQLESNPRLLLKAIEERDLKAVIDDETDYSIDVTVKDYSQKLVSLVNQIKMTTKTRETINLINKLILDNKKVIIWCLFIGSMKHLEKICKNLNVKVRSIYGEVPLEERLELIKQFKNNQIDILITNPHTLAESVSLHHVCHDAIYYEYSFNLVHFLQSKDRIHRFGLPEGQYTQYYFMNNYYIYNHQSVSVSERIYNRLKEKEKIMLDAIGNDVLEDVYSTEEDLEYIFKDV